MGNNKDKDKEFFMKIAYISIKNELLTQGGAAMAIPHIKEIILKEAERGQKTPEEVLDALIAMAKPK